MTLETIGPDPVHKDEDDGKWYFWDETWADRIGPFETRDKAVKASIDYARQLDGLPPFDAEPGI